MDTDPRTEEMTALMHERWGDLPLADKQRLFNLFLVVHDPYHVQAFSGLSHVEKLNIVANNQLEALQWKDAYRTITAIERIEHRRGSSSRPVDIHDFARFGFYPNPPEPMNPVTASAPTPVPAPPPTPAPPSAAPMPPAFTTPRDRRHMSPREREAARRAAQSALDRAIRQQQRHQLQPTTEAAPPPYTPPANGHPPFT